MDSPLAIEATGVFLQCGAECLDEETKAMIRRGVNPLMFPGLHLAVSSDESKAINMDPMPKVIISASGMCEAGRIRHHLKHNLWRENCMVLFVGYQAEGTLGRSLLDGGLRTVKLFNEEVAVNAKIRSMPGKSGHADQAGLLDWLEHFETKPRRVFVNHGEDSVVTFFAELIHEKLGIQTTAPYSGAVFNLASGKFEYEPVGVPVVKAVEKPSTARKNSLYEKLLTALGRLSVIVKNMKGRTNKDVGRLTDQINQLCDKWQ